MILFIRPVQEGPSIGDVLRSVLRTRKPASFKFMYTDSETGKKGEGVLCITCVEAESKKWIVEGSFSFSESEHPCSASAELDLPQYSGTLSVEIA